MKIGMERMIAATRLTRAGRLAEATALLRGSVPSAPATVTTIEGTVAETGTRRVGTFANEAGERPYVLHVPAELSPAPALVVMLHGCTQDPDDFEAGTRMAAVAGAEGCLVLYPGQVARANAQRCWNWFEAGEQVRDRGEPSLVAGLTRRVMAEHGVDPQRVFVAGLSAGGAAAAVLGATYPELYAAIGVHSGLACGAARDASSAFAAMRQGASGSPLGRGVPAIVFHGDRDATVHPANGDAVAAQFGGSGGRVVRGIAGGRGYERRLVEAGGWLVLEQWRVEGAGHAWCGGSPSGSHVDPSGPDATREMLRFFLRREA